LFYCKGTVEEKILSALREKKQLSDEILNNITNYVKEGMKV
jgi:SNF2 family DNA or RNA helicase